MNSWLCLAAGIAVYDTWLIQTGRESLSSQFHRSSRNHPVAVTAVTAYLLAHLYGVLPSNTDPLRGFGAINRRSACQTTRP